MRIIHIAVIHYNHRYCSVSGINSCKASAVNTAVVLSLFSLTNKPLLIGADELFSEYLIAEPCRGSKG